MNKLYINEFILNSASSTLSLYYLGLNHTFNNVFIPKWINIRETQLTFPIFVYLPMTWQWYNCLISYEQFIWQLYIRQYFIRRYIAQLEVFKWKLCLTILDFGLYGRSDRPSSPDPPPCLHPFSLLSIKKIRWNFYVGLSTVLMFKQATLAGPRPRKASNWLCWKACNGNFCTLLHWRNKTKIGYFFVFSFYSSQ